MERLDCVVIGAGVVGLAVGRALARAGREVVVVEKAPRIGDETSSRNSEVIHAGIYYDKGSLMARLCVAGKQQLYAYLAERGLPHRRCGKLIVATSADETPKLAAIRARAAANGVDDLTELSAAEAQALEPALACTGALLSPSTGIIDTHAYMVSLQGDIEADGGMVVLNTPVLEARAVADGFELDFGGELPDTMHARLLINAAGLHAPDLARRITGYDAARAPRAYYAKGSYFSLSGRSPFTRLIYPVPVSGGLGTHLTLDLAGAARFGPDVEWVERIDYAVDPARAESFYGSIRRYWPDLRDGQLQPAYAGIRPKIVPPEVGRQDFRFEGPADHGVPGLVNLFGIESPGLTASLAIGDHVRDLALA